MVVQVGKGKQPVRWLSLVAVQRAKSRWSTAPSGFVVPSGMYKENGEEVGPDEQIRRVFEDDELVTIKVNADSRGFATLVPTVPTRGRARRGQVTSFRRPSIQRPQRTFTVPVNSRGKPATNAWAEVAFTNRNSVQLPSKSECQVVLSKSRKSKWFMEEEQAVEAKSREDSRNQVVNKLDKMAVDVHAAKFRMMMVNGDLEGSAIVCEKMYPDDTDTQKLQEEREKRLVRQEFTSLNLSLMEPDVRQHERIIGAVGKWHSDINAIFKIYAGWGADDSALTMSRNEFQVFAQKINLFEDVQEYERKRRDLNEVFEDANRNGLEKDELDDDMQLTKPEFYVAMIGLAKLRYGEDFGPRHFGTKRKNSVLRNATGGISMHHGKEVEEDTATAFVRFLDDLVLPYMRGDGALLRSDIEFLKAMRCIEVQALFGKHHRALVGLYFHYGTPPTKAKKSLLMAALPPPKLPPPKLTQRRPRAANVSFDPPPATKPSIGQERFMALLIDSHMLNESSGGHSSISPAKKTRGFLDEKDSVNTKSYRERAESILDQNADELTRKEARRAFSMAQNVSVSVGPVMVGKKHPHGVEPIANYSPNSSRPESGGWRWQWQRSSWCWRCSEKAYSACVACR